MRLLLAKDDTMIGESVLDLLRLERAGASTTRQCRWTWAGRVVKNVPAPTNLDIPDYHFMSASTLRIG